MFTVGLQLEFMMWWMPKSWTDFLLSLSADILCDKLFQKEFVEGGGGVERSALNVVETPRVKVLLSTIRFNMGHLFAKGVGRAPRSGAPC